MTDRPRYVLDTNVVVSALLFPDSVPGKAFFEARKRGEVLLSPETVAEIIAVLSRPKFAHYVLPEDRDQFVAALIRGSRLLQPSESVRTCRDPKDDKLLELATSGGASHLITGDQDLLNLDGFRAISIITPATFIASLA